MEAQIFGPPPFFRGSNVPTVGKLWNPPLRRLRMWGNIEAPFENYETSGGNSGGNLNPLPN